MMHAQTDHGLGPYATPGVAALGGRDAASDLRREMYGHWAAQHAQYRWVRLLVVAVALSAAISLVACVLALVHTADLGANVWALLVTAAALQGALLVGALLMSVLHVAEKLAFHAAMYARIEQFERLQGLVPRVPMFTETPDASPGGSELRAPESEDDDEAAASERPRPSMTKSLARSLSVAGAAAPPEGIGLRSVPPAALQPDPSLPPPPRDTPFARAAHAAHSDDRRRSVALALQRRRLLDAQPLAWPLYSAPQ